MAEKVVSLVEKLKESKTLLKMPPVEFAPHVCRDCMGEHKAEHYVVLVDEVWEQVRCGPPYGKQNKRRKADYSQVLCFWCIEDRLGRRLMIPDLVFDALCNRQWQVYILVRDEVTVGKKLLVDRWLGRIS